MTSYVTPDDVRRILTADLTRTTGTAASLEDPDLQVHIDTAQAQVDGVLTKIGHVTPITPPPAPEIIRSVTRAIAGYLADLSYRQGKAHESERDPVVARYLWARDLLDAWGKGTSKPAGLPDPATGASTGDVVVGEPINPPRVGLADSLYAQPGACAPGYPLDWDYQPDAVRWGASRNWM